MHSNRSLLCSLFALSVAFYSCHKDNVPLPAPNPPVTNPNPPVIKTDTLDKKQILGWWDAIKWAYPDNSLRNKKMYFGIDSFFYMDDPGGSQLGASTGQWWWKDNDSVRIVVNAGWSRGDVVWKITTLTRDTLRYQQGVYPGEYQRKDSLPITSKPIYTIAGDGTVGQNGDNGPASAARFNNPNSVMVDAAGNIYITEELGHCVRKMTISDGKIRTVAGTGSDFYNGDGGLATATSLNSPSSVIIDRAGNLIIADYDNESVRKVSAADGTVSTIVGKRQFGAYPYFGGDGGPAKDALLHLPSSLVMDAVGNLYISDGGNYRVRKVDATTGIVTTIAGNGTYGYSGDNGPATKASITCGPIALDPTGQNLYIGDWEYRIRKLSLATDIITTVAGTGIQGYNGEGKDALQTQLIAVTGLAFDSKGNLYFSQASYNGRDMRVRKLSAVDNTITTVAGSGGSFMNGFTGYSGDGVHATAFLLNFPSGICFDKDGNLLIADKNGNRIRKVLVN